MGAAPAPAGATGNDGDVKMAGMEDAAPSGQAAGDQADDWVVVPQGGVSPPAGATAPAGKNGDGSTPGAGAAQQASSASAGVTPAVDFGGDGDPGDFGSLEDLDTAGDALAAFGDGGNNGDDDGDEMGRGGESGADGAAVDLGMDDSAFGDAFHPVDDPGHASGSPRDVL